MVAAGHPVHIEREEDLWLGCLKGERRQRWSSRGVVGCSTRGPKGERGKVCARSPATARAASRARLARGLSSSPSSSSCREISGSSCRSSMDSLVNADLQANSRCPFLAVCQWKRTIRAAWRVARCPPTPGATRHTQVLGRRPSGGRSRRRRGRGKGLCRDLTPLLPGVGQGKAADPSGDHCY
jgi:hypothetical protein